MERNKIRSRSLPLGSHQFSITTHPRFVGFCLILHEREIKIRFWVVGSDESGGKIRVLGNLWEVGNYAKIRCAIFGLHRVCITQYE